MIGFVSEHHAILPVPLRLAGQPDLNVEFVIDTGFVGFLTLPPRVVETLELSFLRRITANLADDSNIAVSVYVATIVWHGAEREVEVLATGRRPLLGTLLLDGFDLRAQFGENGLVTLDAL